ncbi:hypothetical protein GA0074695_2435 [Micromonospora viridifaciens]|uniref:Uncharacterized protein n=1 Tax=Micromonospora viridifaciens TaxID=1881 RepID=A0A1C4WH80_MICVI|nr:DUF5994 family protein [Micromonospora viridifaciens]SCE95509.1 hypothetical protein GA0074695_2435 [Micromonospora viridifaciens]
MTPSTNALAPPSPPSTPRLRIEPTRAARTLLDGGWWPRSTNPLAELPGLVLAIDLLHGPIVRLLLNTETWDGNPRRLTIGGRVLRLGYFTSQPASLLTAICLNEARVDLLVVPPDTPADLAEAAMARAATAGNIVHTPQLLTAAAHDVRGDGRQQGLAHLGGGGGRLRTAPGDPAAVASRIADAGPAGHSAPTEPAPPPTQRRTGNLPTIATEEQIMTIARHTIVSALRRRGQHTRADWVERELPEQVDTTRHAGLLATLRLDPAELDESTAR